MDALHTSPQPYDAPPSVLAALRSAAERGELQVLYQPVVDLLTGKISGMEALLRWNSPELGLVSPVTFIPIAENSGLIDGIGLWVLRKVCQDIRFLLDGGFDIPHVAVNVSPIQFRDPHLVQHVQRTLEDFQIEPHRVHIEITESTLMDDVNRCEAVLRALKAMGLRLSLDDFGTGYSSLSYLKRYPFNKVKIDQSFVKDVDTNQADVVIVNVIVGMAHGLGLEVVAEGVETEAQCEIMRTSGCDEIQGHFFSRPVDRESVQALLLEGRQLPAHLLRFRARPRTLLLVDDEPNVLASLKRLFRRDGYVIHTANSGTEGLDVLAGQRIDVIMSDQRMPGMTGVEFLRAVKIKYPETIRIVLSGYAELQYVTEAINEGAIYRFLTKPWDDDQLREQVQRAFEHSELQEKNQQLDIKIRCSNRDLVVINRQLNEAIETNRKQIDRGEVSLAIAREALQFVPSPIIGVDDDGLMIFVNTAAEAALVRHGPLIGMELLETLPAVATVLDGVVEGEVGTLSMDGSIHAIKWHRMGKASRSMGKLIFFLNKGDGHDGR
ncbi:MAG: EAL domain-containing protein [Pseudomonadota bacterium]